MSIKYTLSALFLLSALNCGAFFAGRDSVSLKQTLFNAVDQLSLTRLENKFAKTEKQLTHVMLRSLEKFRRSEDRLLKKLKSKDSIAANLKAKDFAEKYNRISSQIQSPEKQLSENLSGGYVARLDSLRTLLDFRQAGLAEDVSVPQLKAIGDLKRRIRLLQVQMNTADAVKKFVANQQAQWKEQLSRLGLAKELLQFKKQAYYYQQEINEYKQLLNDPDKLAQKALSIASTLPAYKSFMAQNSQLAQLFRMPGANPGAAGGVPGLQTQNQVQQLLQQQLSGAGANSFQQLQEQAGGVLNDMKSKLNEWGDGDGELPMPDFKPNQQKTKKLLKRLEFGLNVQSQRSSNILPSTTDVGLQAGYKLNDKSVIGVGVAYKMGWGKNLSEIRITHEGVGLRSFADIKLKKSIWITGAFEYNYQQAIRSVEQLKDLTAWQKSAMLGISKKYRIGNAGRQGKLQLLWDFLSYSQVPRTPAIKFRLGYQL